MTLNSRALLRPLLLVVSLMLGMNLSAAIALASEAETNKGKRAAERVNLVSVTPSAEIALDHANKPNPQFTIDRESIVEAAAASHTVHVANLAEAPPITTPIAPDADSVDATLDTILDDLPPTATTVQEYRTNMPASTLVEQRSAAIAQATAETDVMGQSGEANPDDTDTPAGEANPDDTDTPAGEANPDDTDADAEAKEKAAKEEAAMKLWGALSLFNHTPYVFGTPGTSVGNFSTNTQLGGDWGGFRTKLVKRGIFLDITSNTAPQGVVSGGRSGGTSVGQNIDIMLNLSTDLLGWWKGGFFHFNVAAKFGGTLQQAGALSPLNYAEIWPVIQAGDYIALSEYYYLQSLGSSVQFAVGKANLTNFADANVFANNSRYQFQNGSLGNNLMLGAYAPPVTWVTGFIWEPAPWATIISVVFDPNAAADNFATDFFKDIAVAQQISFKYKIGKKPGSFLFGWVWSSKGGTNFADPLNVTRDGRLDFQDPIRIGDSGYMIWSNFSQYLYLVPEEKLDPKQKFLTPRGLGLFGRFGIGPDASNLVSTFGSFGVGGKGMIRGREHDQFGLGWYYLNFADGTVDLLRNVGVLVGGSGDNFKNETGFEAYYNFAVTPALQLSLNAQYIINPFLSRSSNVFVLGGRVQMSF